MLTLATEDLALLKTLGFVPSVLTPGEWSMYSPGALSITARLSRPADGNWRLWTWEGSVATLAPFCSQAITPLLMWAKVEGLI